MHDNCCLLSDGVPHDSHDQWHTNGEPCAGRPCPGRQGARFTTSDLSPQLCWDVGWEAIELSRLSRSAPLLGAGGAMGAPPRPITMGGLGGGVAQRNGAPPPTNNCISRANTSSGESPLPPTDPRSATRGEGGAPPSAIVRSRPRAAVFSGRTDSQERRCPLPLPTPASLIRGGQGRGCAVQRDHVIPHTNACFFDHSQSHTAGPPSP